MFGENVLPGGGGPQLFCRNGQDFAKGWPHKYILSIYFVIFSKASFFVFFVFVFVFRSGRGGGGGAFSPKICSQKRRGRRERLATS